MIDFENLHTYSDCLNSLAAFAEQAQVKAIVQSLVAVVDLAIDLNQRKYGMLQIALRSTV
jgi:hypothetical protein